MAVHTQSAAVAATEIGTRPPAAPTLSRVGWMTSVQGEAACDTTTDWPATATLAVRSLGDVFWVALTVTVPAPAPVAPAVMATQGAAATAVHPHPTGAVTESVREVAT